MKKLFALLLAAVMVLGLVACGPSGNDQTEPPKNNDNQTQAPGKGTEPPKTDAPEGKKYDGVTLNYWSTWSAGEPQATVIEQAAAAFEAETGAHINIEWKGRDISTLLSASLEAGDAIDIFEDDYNRIGNVYKDYTADLTDMAAAADYASHSYPIFAAQSIAWAGYLNSITEQPQIGGIFYNRDAFEQASITDLPTTWAEFLDICQKLKDAGIAPLAQDSAYCNFTFYNQLVRHLGEDGIAALRDNGHWAENEDAVAAAQELIDLINAGYLVDGAPDEYPASQNKVGTGEAAMVVCANYATAEVDSVMGDTNWGLINYPAVEGGADPNSVYIGATGLAIASYSENKQAAFDFCMYLVTGEWDQKMADTAKQIPADPSNTCSYLPTAVDTLKNADATFGWCTSLNTHAAWGTMKTLFVELFEGKYATGADFCAAIDDLY